MPNGQETLEAYPLVAAKQILALATQRKAMNSRRPPIAWANRLEPRVHLCYAYKIARPGKESDSVPA
jgi:hypothetical protein